MKYLHIIPGIIFLFVTGACGDAQSGDNLSAHERWAKNALVGEWTSDTNPHVYTFATDGSFTIQVDGNIVERGRYQLPTGDLYYVQMHTIEWDILLDCRANGEIIFYETVDGMYSSALWSRSERPVQCPPPAPTALPTWSSSEE